MLPIILRTFYRSLISLLLFSALVFVLAIEAAPCIPLGWHPDVQLSRALFRKTAAQVQNNDNLDLSEQELNHAINSVVNRFILSATHIHFTANNSAIANVALQIHRQYNCCYVNLSFHLDNKNGILTIEQLKIGKLTFGQAASEALFNFGLKHSLLKHYYFLAKQHIKAIRIQNNHIQINYAFNALANTATNVKEPRCTKTCADAELPPSTMPEALAFYQQQIANIVHQHDISQRLSLASLLQPLFKAAYQRSSPATAISDNIAIIYTICAYVNKNEIPFYIPIKQLLTQIRIHPVFLYKRTDQAKHFMLSAALTVTGGHYLADILGQEKELRDAFSSSGFSFIDLAANRAGMKFSERATASPKDAKELQRIMSEITDYHEFMPVTQDLPEKLSNVQFTQQFDSISSPAYQQLLQVIDDRIDALPIYRH